MADPWAGFTVEMDRGDTRYIDFTVSLSGVAQNITGWTLFFSAKRRPADVDASAVIRKSTIAGGVTINSAAAGTAYVTISPADTVNLSAVKTVLFAELQGKDPAGNIYTLAKGRLTIRPDLVIATS